MKSSKFQTLLFSAAGVVLVFISLVGLNLIVSPARVRLDLTADKLHTLSDGTKQILKRIDGPIEMRLYVSKGKERMPEQLKTYAQSVEDLLSEFRVQTGGKIEIKKFDPEPDSEAEDSAKLDGVQGQQLSNGEQFYLGLAIENAPEKVSLPFLSPQREKLLEYDLARAVSQVLSTNKPVVGIMTPLPVMGGFNPMQMQMGRMGQSEPWVFVSELKRDFDVQSVAMDVDKIDEKIKVLIVIHPRDITDKAQYAIDQFVLRGGKLAVFVDALCISDTQRQQPSQMGMNFGTSSTLPKLFKAWGYEFGAQVVADTQFMKELGGRDGRPQPIPGFLFVNAKGVDPNDAATAQIDDIWMPFPGAIQGAAVAGLKSEPLVFSSKDSQLVDGITAQLNSDKVLQDFKSSGVAYNLGLRISGKFKTAFPDGNPVSKGDTNAPAASDAGLKESAKDNAVYVFSDVDMLANNFTVQINPMFRIANPVNANLSLLQNIIEQAAGDASLVGARSRASIRRPFTRVQEMEAVARKSYQAKIEELDKKLQDLQGKLSEMQVKKEGDTARLILSPEQQQALKNFTEQQANTRKELRVTRRNLRQDVDALENRLKWLNIAAMPIVVTAVGISLAVVRRRKMAAR